jgi:hypothetical protein
MANVALNTMYSQILPYLPGAETPLVDLQLRKVLREFMKRTTIYRETFMFNTTPGVSTYKLVPVFGQVSSIIDAWGDNGKTLMRAIPEERRVPIEARKPYGWFSQVPDYVTFYPTPDAAYPIMVSAAIMLQLTDNEYPEEILHHHAEVVAAGVLAAMYGMPGKPWTQSKAAVDAGRMFGRGINTIRAKLRDGGQPNQSTFRGIVPFGV